MAVFIIHIYIVVDNVSYCNIRCNREGIDLSESLMHYIYIDIDNVNTLNTICCTHIFGCIDSAAAH